MQFEIIKGNIINAHTDAIVLPGNQILREGPGASAAIFEAAGRKKLTKACKDVLKKLGGKAETGSAVPTLAFDLGSKYVVHAIVPKWVDGEHSEYELLCSAYISSLKIADIMGCTSIAFPLLAAGNNGFDLNLAFEIAAQTFKDFSGTSLQRIVLIIHGNRIATIVKEKGYNYSIEVPDFIAFEKKNLLAQKESNQQKFADVMDDAAEVAHGFLRNQIDNALEYLKDPENQQALLNKAISLAKLAIKLVK